MIQPGLLAEILTSVLIVLGASFALIGSWGLVRLPTLMERLHGPTKATTLGLGGILLGSVSYFQLTGRLVGAGTACLDLPLHHGPDLGEHGRQGPFARGATEGWRLLRKPGGQTARFSRQGRLGDLRSPASRHSGGYLGRIAAA